MSNRNETPPTTRREVDTERVDTGRARWQAAVVAIVVGLLIGGAVGAFAGTLPARTYQASTALSVLPDAVALNSDNDTSNGSLDPTAFIQGQLVTLNGDAVSTAVQQQLRLADSPQISVTEVGQTFVVQIDATASSEQEAQAVATATGQVYSNLRTSRLATSLNNQLRATNARLAKVQDALAAQQRAVPAGSPATPAETALQTEVERLLSLSGTLSLNLPQVSDVVTVEAPAHTVAGGLSKSVLGGGIGAVLGAVLAILALALYRRFSPRVGGVGDLVDLGLPVLLPALPRSTRVRTAAALGRLPAVRLLAARLRRRAHGQLIVLVGPTAGVGTSRTAIALAAASAPAGPVLLVHADETSPADPDHADARRVLPTGVSQLWVLPGAGDLAGAGHDDYAARSAALVDAVRRAAEAGWTVVIDAPPLADSDLALDCLTLAGSAATLVVGRSRSRPADVLAAAELLEARSADLAGVILNDPPRWSRRGRVDLLPPGETPGPPLATASAPPAADEQPTGPIPTTGGRPPAIVGAAGLDGRQ